MAWPPPVLPINRTNADPQQDTHPADHNALALASNDTVAHAKKLTPTPGQAFSPIDGANVPAGTVLKMAAGKMNVTTAADGGAVLPIPGAFTVLVSVVVTPAVIPGAAAGQGAQDWVFNVALRSTPGSCVLYCTKGGVKFQGLVGVCYIAIGY